MQLVAIIGAALSLLSIPVWKQIIFEAFVNHDKPLPIKWSTCTTAVLVPKSMYRYNARISDGLRWPDAA